MPGQTPVQPRSPAAGIPDAEATTTFPRLPQQDGAPFLRTNCDPPALTSLMLRIYSTCLSRSSVRRSGCTICQDSSCAGGAQHPLLPADDSTPVVISVFRDLLLPQMQRHALHIRGSASACIAPGSHCMRVVVISEVAGLVMWAPLVLSASDSGGRASHSWDGMDFRTPLKDPGRRPSLWVLRTPERTRLDMLFPN